MATVNFIKTRSTIQEAFELRLGHILMCNLGTRQKKFFFFTMHVSDEPEDPLKLDARDI